MDSMMNCPEYLTKHYTCTNRYKWTRLISLMKMSTKWVDVLTETYRTQKFINEEKHGRIKYVGSEVRH